MRLLNREQAVPVLALGTALAISAGCSGSTPEAPSIQPTHATVANPNFVPQLQALGGKFLSLYNRAPSADRSTPFESDHLITVAEVDVHIGAQVLKLTINQLPSPNINPRTITSLDILRFNQSQPLAGFDMNFGRNTDGTLDASCAAYHKPQGFSESHQATLYEHDGSPFPGSSPRLADGFLSDTLTEASQLLDIASHDLQDPSTPQYSTGDPCGVNFGY